MKTKTLSIALLVLMCLTTTLIARAETQIITTTNSVKGTKTETKNYTADAGYTLSVTATTTVTTVAPPPQIVLPIINWNVIIALLSAFGNSFLVWVWRKWSNRKPIPGVVARPSMRNQG